MSEEREAKEVRQATYGREVNTEELQELLKIIWKTNKLVPLVIGSHGIGKTQIPTTMAKKELKWEYENIRIATQEVGDLTGIPQKSNDGKTHHWTRPAWLPSEVYKKRKLVIFDEINRGRNEEEQALFQAMDSRRLHSHKFPTTLREKAIMNPCDQDYKVSDLDPAFEDRFVKIWVKLEASCWLRWAENEDIHPTVLEFITKNPHMLQTTDATPRAWVRVSNLMKLMTIPQTEKFIKRLSIGNVGMDIAHVFEMFVFKRLAVMPIEGDKILKDYKTHRKTIQKWNKDKEFSVLLTTVRNVQELLPSYTPETGIVENLKTFILDLPKDSQYTIMNEIVVKQSPFMKPLGKNKEIMKMLITMKDAMEEAEKTKK